MFTRIALASVVTATIGCTSGNSGTSVDAAPAVGPGAMLQCESSGMNAFDTYGAPAFLAVNTAIFTAVGNDIQTNGTTKLGDSFGKIGDASVAATKDNGGTFQGKLAAFLVFAYGGPDHITFTDGVVYDGPQDMTAAHTGLGITSDQFDYFVSSIIVPVLDNANVKHGAGGAADPDDVGTCFAPVVTGAAFKASIVGK